MSLQWCEDVKNTDMPGELKTGKFFSETLR